MRLHFWLIASFLIPVHLLCAADYVSVAELGLSLQSGHQTSSLNGATGGVVTLRSQQAKGKLRFQNAADFGLVSGLAYLGSSTVSSAALAITGNYTFGAYLYPFAESKLNPFLGGGGVAGWSQLRLGSPPALIDAITDGLFFGFEVSAGCDLNLGGGNGRALRIRTSFWSAAGGLGGQSSFDLSSFRILIGTLF